MNRPSPAFHSYAPQVSVIVVSADSGEGLRECISRVLACSTPLELVLIDNASRDGIPQAIARARDNDPRFKWLYNGTNVGFGPAVNRAAKQARGSYLLILNPDCLIEQDDLERLIEIATREARIGVIGAVVCDEKGVPDPASYRRDPLFSRALATLFGASKGGVNVAGDMPEDVVEAEAVSGALMLVPRHVFDWLNGFDEEYFLHCEDLDLCRRARDGGWRVLLAGDVRVIHAKGTSSNHRPVFVSRYKHRGMWRWFRKFDPAARNFVMRGIVWGGLWTHFALQIPGQLLRRRKS